MIKKSHYLYLIFGFTTFVIYYSLTSLFYTIFQFPYQLSIALAYGTASVFHFAANKYFTFSASDYPVKHNLFKYFILAIFNYLIQLIIVATLFRYLSLNFYFSIFAATVFITLFSYVVLDKWVFRKDKHDYC